MKINADVKAKNWLSKKYVINGLNGVLVNLNVNVISYGVGEYLDYRNCKCRKRLVDKLVEECIENVDKKKLHQNKMI